MFEHLRALLVRPTFLLAAGIAIGALLAPSFGGSGAQGVTTYTRAVSCQGLAFQPNTDSAYTASGTLRSGANGSYFICGVDLPHKAVVTRVRFTLLDSGSFGWVTNCALVRVGLEPASATAFQVMALVPTTSDSGSQIKRLADTTIDFKTVDNTTFAYFLQCQIQQGAPNAAGIYGADVTYKITAANG